MHKAVMRKRRKLKLNQLTPTINMGWVKPRNKVKTSVESKYFPSK